MKTRARVEIVVSGSDSEPDEVTPSVKGQELKFDLPCRLVYDGVTRYSEIFSSSLFLFLCGCRGLFLAGIYNFEQVEFVFNGSVYPNPDQRKSEVRGSERGLRRGTDSCGVQRGHLVYKLCSLY